MAKELKITAKAKDGTVEGEQVFQVAENLKEAVKIDGEEEVFALYYKSKVIKLRANLYAKAPGTGRRSVRKEVYEKLIQAGMSVSEAERITGYTAETVAPAS